MIGPLFRRQMPPYCAYVAMNGSIWLCSVREERGRPEERGLVLVRGEAPDGRRGAHPSGVEADHVEAGQHLGRPDRLRGAVPDELDAGAARAARVHEQRADATVRIARRQADQRERDGRPAGVVVVQRDARGGALVRGAAARPAQHRHRPRRGRGLGRHHRHPGRQQGEDHPAGQPPPSARPRTNPTIRPPVPRRAFVPTGRPDQPERAPARSGRRRDDRPSRGDLVRGGRLREGPERRGAHRADRRQVAPDQVALDVLVDAGTRRPGRVPRRVQRQQARVGQQLVDRLGAVVRRGRVVHVADHEDRRRGDPVERPEVVVLAHDRPGRARLAGVDPVGREDRRELGLLRRPRGATPRVAGVHRVGADDAEEGVEAVVVGEPPGGQGGRGRCAGRRRERGVVESPAGPRRGTPSRTSRRARPGGWC